MTKSAWMFRFTPSASRHGITQDQARYVIAHCGFPFTAAPPPGAAGGDRFPYLGDDAQGLALEVVALPLSDTELLVIHAMSLRRQYQTLYEEAMPWRKTP